MGEWSWRVAVWFPWRRRAFGTFGRWLWCWRAVRWSRNGKGTRSRMYLTGSRRQIQRTLAELDRTGW